MAKPVPWIAKEAAAGGRFTPVGAMSAASLVLWSVLVVVLCLFVQTSCGQGRAVHRSPCPSVFEYQHDGQKWFGTITLPSPKYGTEGRLRVTMSLAAKLPTKYSGSIDLAGGKNELLNKIQNGYPLTYIINFPLLWPIPKITGIYFNNRKLCSGPAESFGNGVTTLTDISLDHTLTTGDGLGGGSYYPDDTNYPIYPGRPNFPEIPTSPAYPVRPSAPTYPSRPANPTFADRPNINTGFSDSEKEAIDDFIKEFLMQTPSNPKPPPELPPRVQPTPAPLPIPPQTPSSPPPHRPKPLTIENRPAESTNYQCGLPRIGNPLVVNGDRTSEGMWPWMVAIYWRNENIKFHCASSLISNRHVLTAGQCVQGLSASKILLRLGVFNINDWQNDYTKLVGVSSITIHPQYNKKKLTNDIAVVKSNNEIVFTDYIIPVCLWDSDSDQNIISGRDGTVVGWGRDENEVSTDEPRVVKIPVISTEACKSNSTKHFQITSDNTLCAGGRDGSGPCNGDSGTGVYMAQNSRWYIRGIVSVALADIHTRLCDLSEFVVLTDVAKYMPWIKSVTGL